MTEEPLDLPYSNAPATRKGRTARTIAVWIFLIACYTGLYFLTGLDPVYRYGFWCLIAFIVVLCVVSAFRFRPQLARFHRDVVAAIAANARGDHERAYKTYWTWAERTKIPTIAATARYSLAWTLMRQGKLQHAIAVATENDDRNQGALTTIGMFPTSAIDLALCHALLGDMAAAEQWMTRTEQRSHLMSHSSLAAMKLFVRAIVDCRAGRPDDAVLYLDERWAEHEGMLAGDALRPLRIVRAFAIAACGPRSSGVADTMVSLSRPAYPGEYDFLGVGWPEMASFLASQGLSRRTTTDDHSAAS